MKDISKHGVHQLNVPKLDSCVNSHLFETVELFVLLFIVPLDRADLVEAVDSGQSVDDMRAQEGINVAWGEFAILGPVLGPVGHVAHQFVGGS